MVVKEIYINCQLNTTSMDGCKRDIYQLNIKEALKSQNKLVSDHLLSVGYLPEKKENTI